MKEPRQGRKSLFDNGFLSPLQGSHGAFSFQGFAALTPGYFLIAPSGARRKTSFRDRKLFRFLDLGRFSLLHALLLFLVTFFTRVFHVLLVLLFMLIRSLRILRRSPSAPESFPGISQASGLHGE